ncbi:MAG: N-acetyl-gamma-glutamyl-phosphate reductase [Solirubrobacterales bacterium]
MNDTPQPLDGVPAARVIVAGASGFAGALAARLVWRHPRLELAAITARADAGTRLDRLYPRHRVPLELGELDLERLEGIDAAVVAYPHGAATPVVAEMRGLGIQVVDLSADFRLVDASTYERWYGSHGDPSLLAGAVYGLTELARDRIREAELVANPGCYPTAALLALAPLAERRLVDEVVVDAKSGVSGAGRARGDELSFVNVDENFLAYGVDGHRHQPEIEQELERLGVAVPLTFVPHLLPLDQGLLATCYVTLTEAIDSDALGALFADRYAGDPFVELVEAPPGVRDVRETNLCRIQATLAGERRAVVFAAIDNLWKGAAGQAVQNLNLMLGLEETEGFE